MKTSFADILRQVTREGDRKMGTKVPSWQDIPGLVFPTSLSTQQCSSEETARFKASIVQSLGCRRVADLTGGLGVDSWAFSQVCDSILYNEMDEMLAETVKENFKILGVANASFSNLELTPSNLEDIIGDFLPDMIFLDPARRSDTGRKVFLLEECRPDVLRLKDKLLQTAPHVMIKLSPMADISLVARQLGGNVTDIFLLGSAGECKELLVLMDREEHGEYRISVHENGNSFTFVPSEESATVPSMAEGNLAGKLLFEPGKALMKSGAFNLISGRNGMRKAGRSTHLYISDAIAEEFRSLGKWYSIESVVPLNNRTIKETGRLYPRCEVSSKNLPLTSDQLRKKMGSTSGGTAHIFAFHCDCADSNLLAVTSRLSL